MNRRVVLGLVVLAYPGSIGCGHFKLALDRCPATRVASGKKAVVQYLGTGGYLVTVEGKSILLGPHFSNPSIGEVAFDHTIRTDPALLEPLLPPEANDAVGILTGHSHYDHLLDVPYVAVKRAKHADVYGNATMVNMLQPIVPQMSAAHRLIGLDAYAGDFIPPHLSPTGIRILPILSEHSEQLTLSLPFGIAKWPIHMFRGHQEEPQTELPRTASDWAEGTVLAYLIDFLDANGDPIFRVYYQDSGSNAPRGMIPWDKAGTKKVDVALICAGGDTERLHEHPKAIIEDAKPRYVILGHWEDIFRTQRAPCDEPKKSARKVHAIPNSHFDVRQLIGKTETERFQDKARDALRAVDGEAVYLPCPTGSRFELPIGGNTARPEKDRPQNICSKFNLRTR